MLVYIYACGCVYLNDITLLMLLNGFLLNEIHVFGVFCCSTDVYVCFVCQLGCGDVAIGGGDEDDGDDDVGYDINGEFEVDGRGLQLDPTSRWDAMFVRQSQLTGSHL